MSVARTARELLTPPNLLSLSRIPIAIWIVFLLPSRTPSSSLLAFLALCLAGLTDFFDGLLARRAEQRSGRANHFGVILDPVADKILAVILIGALVVYREFPLWLAAIVLLRDLVILAAGALILHRRKVVLPSNLPGKYYFASLAFLLAAYVAGFRAGVTLLQPLTVALWLLSSSYYARILVRVLRGEDYQSQAGSPGGQRLRVIATVVVCLTLAGFFVYESPFQLW